MADKRYAIVALVICCLADAIAVPSSFTFANFETTPVIGAAMIFATAMIEFLSLFILVISFVATCECNTDDHDWSMASCALWSGFLRLRGIAAIVVLAGVGCLTAGVLSSDGHVATGVVAIIAAFIAACAELVMACVGVAEALDEDTKDRFCRLFRAQSEYATIDS